MTASATPAGSAFERWADDQRIEDWARLLAQMPVTPELMAQWKAVFDQCLEIWSRAIGDLMDTEEFARLLGRTVDQWLLAQRPLSTAAKASVDATRTDAASRAELAAVAERLAGLEAQIARLDARLERVLRKPDDVTKDSQPRQPRGARPRSKQRPR